MEKTKTLKELFDSNKSELENKLEGLMLPTDSGSVRQIIAVYMNNLFDGEGEFRQSLTQSEDYVLQSALSLLNAQQEISKAIIHNKRTEGFSNSENTSQSNDDETHEQTSCVNKKKSGIQSTSLNPLQSMAGSAGGALVGKLLLGGWGAVFGAIAGTAITVYLASRQSQDCKDCNNDTETSIPNGTEDENPIDTKVFVSIVSNLCESVDNLISTFRAQINRVSNKYQNQEKPSIENTYLPIIENIQSLIGYARTHGDDEKSIRKIRERIEDLGEMLDTYNLTLVNYDDEHGEWFEKTPSANTTTIKMVYPAIVKNGKVV